MDFYSVVQGLYEMAGGKHPHDIIERVALWFLQYSGKNEMEQINDITSLLVDGTDLIAWLKRHEVKEEPKKQCQICLEDFEVTHMYTVSCAESHRFCFPCFVKYTTQAIDEGKLVSCPSGDCKYTLQRGDIEEVGIEVSFLQKYDKTQLHNVLRSLKAVGCPKRNCTNFVVPSEEGVREPCFCDRCKFEFCSLCQQRYHWRTECNEVGNIQERWLWWGNVGREQYWRRKAANEKQYQHQLKIYLQEKSKHDKDVNELQHRMKEEEEDERWKAANCRLCPSCKRPINKLEGCNSMTCGQDYHGGNTQNGCGAKFSWAQALPYAPSVQHRSAANFKIQSPDQIAAVDNGPYECEICQQTIKGLRFSCLNCKFYDVCEECEANGIAIHDNHLFKIINLEQ